MCPILSAQTSVDVLHLAVDIVCVTLTKDFQMTNYLIPMKSDFGRLYRFHFRPTTR